MRSLRYLLVTDGSSDQVLIYVLGWLLGTILPNGTIDAVWSDPGELPSYATGRLNEKIRLSLERYSRIDILFIHRDAEKQSREQRLAEIGEALEGIEDRPAICVIPVRMTEAWLLIDEQSLRLAAGNPNGRMPVSMPAINTLESIPDPKNVLYELLKQACGLSGRRLKKFRPERHTHRLAELINDYSPLYQLPAFQALDADMRDLLGSHDPI